MGELWENMKILIHFRKKVWVGQEWWRGGGGVQNMEKYFFAFLDELDHLEAEKKY